MIGLTLASFEKEVDFGKAKRRRIDKMFRLFDVLSPVGVLLYAFGRRKRHSASFLNSHTLPKNKFFDKLKAVVKTAFFTFRYVL